MSDVDEYLKALGSAHLAESLLADLASRARPFDVEVATHASTSAPADAICDVAAQVDADLIVVGNKGMTGMRRVLGSVPNAVAIRRLRGPDRLYELRRLTRTVRLDLTARVT